MAFSITASAGNAATINSGAANKARSPEQAPASGVAGAAGFNANVGAAKAVNTPAQKPATLAHMTRTTQAVSTTTTTPAPKSAAPTAKTSVGTAAKTTAAAVKAPVAGTVTATDMNSPTALKTAAATITKATGVSLQQVKNAGVQAMGQYVEMAKDPARRELLVKAITGKASIELAKDQQAKIMTFLDGLAAGKVPPVDYRLAGVAGSPEMLRAAMVIGGTMLPAGVKGAFADVGPGKAGMVAVSNQLGGADLKTVILEEMGEALVAAAERAGIKKSKGDGGNRMRLAVAGRDASSKAMPTLNSDQKDDTARIVVDGKLVIANALLFLPGSSISQAVSIADMTPNEFAGAIYKEIAKAVDNYIAEWKKNPANALKNLAIFILTTTNTVGSIIYSSVELAKHWGKMDGTQRALAIGLIGFEVVATVIPGGAAAGAGSRIFRVLSDASRTIGNRAATKVPALASKIPSAGVSLPDAKIKALNAEQATTMKEVNASRTELKAQEKLLVEARKELVNGRRGKDYAQQLKDVDEALAATRSSLAKVYNQSSELVRLQERIRKIKSLATSARNAAIAANAAAKAANAITYVRKINTLQRGHLVSINKAKGGIANLKPNVNSIKIIDSKIELVNNNYKVQSDRITIAQKKVSLVKGQNSGQVNALGHFKAKLIPDLRKQLADARKEALGVLGIKKKQLLGRMPHPFWATMSGTSAALAAGPSTSTGLGSVVSALKRTRSSTDLERVSGPTAKRMRQGFDAPPSPRPSSASSGSEIPVPEMRSLATRVNRYANTVEAQPMIVGMSRAFTTIAASGAVAALGKVLKEMGVPLLNDGKPATIFAFNFKGQANSAGGIMSARGPYVGYSPPNTAVSNSNISFSIVPKTKFNIPGISAGEKIGFIISYAVNAGKTEVGNVGNGHSLVLGNFAYATAAITTKLAGRRNKLGPIFSRLNSLPGAKNTLKQYFEPEVDAGFQARFNFGKKNIVFAAWGAAAFGWGVLPPEQQSGMVSPVNRLLAKTSPGLIVSSSYAPNKLQFAVPFAGSAKRRPTPPPAPPPTTPGDPGFVPPEKVPPKEKKNTVVTDPKVYANRPVKGLVVELSPALRARYGLMDWVRVYDYKGRLISSLNPAKPAAKFSFKINSGSAPDIVQVRTAKGTTMNFKLSGAGTTVFGINRSAAGQKVNFKSGGKHVGAFTDSKLGWSRIAIGDKDRKINQPSAVFHVVPPRNARPGTLKLETLYRNPARVAVAQRLADNDSRDIDYNPGIIKRDAAHNLPVRLVVSYISKTTGRPVKTTINISHLGNAKAKVTSTGISLKAANGPKVYYDERLSHTIYLANMP